MMKRFWALALALCMVLSMMPITASAATVVTRYECGSDGDDVTATLTSDGVMTISGSGRMDDFNQYVVNNEGGYKLNIYWDEYFDRITTVIVEDGVTYIGDNAFLGATELTEVEIADSVTEIGIHSFMDCPKLSTIRFGTGLQKTGTEVFLNCDSLTEVTLPRSNVSYGTGIFSKCRNLGSVTIPEEQTTIGEAMFKYCKALTRINIPDSITSIGGGAFEGTGLTSIDIPDSVTEIRSSAFANCDGLTAVEIPGSVAKINSELFANCDSLTQVTFNEGITEMSFGIFSFCQSIEDVTIPSTVTEMVRTFEFSYSVKTVTFLGDAPEMSSQLFEEVTATAYYPAGNETWTSSVRKNYGGTITWKAKVMPPKAPAVEIENVASSGKPKLTWNAASNAVKYEVYRATSQNGTYKKLTTTSGTSLTNTSAEAGKTYYYKVRSVGADGAKSDFSNIVSRRCDLPRPVISLSNIASTGKIKISWEPVEGAKKYEVYRSTDKQNWTKLITTTGTSLTNSSAEAGTLYYYRVRAIHENSAANSAYSAIKSKRCDLPRPVITLSNIASTGKIMISWKPIEGAVKYQVYRSTDNENWTRLITTTGTSLTNSSAEAGVLYYYKVRAIASNSEANSAYSTVKSRTCDLAQPVLTVELNAAGKPYLTWEALDGAVKYRVDRSTDGENWTRLITTTGTKLTNSSAEAGITYYYRIFAISSNSSANSAYSEIVSITAG